MSRADPQFNLRIPADLKAQIEEASRLNKRSATAEIVSRLAATFELDAHMASRSMGNESHTSLPSYLAYLEKRDSVMDALDLGNPASMERLEQLIERAVKRALDTTTKD